jgi:hypothetical protein
MENLLLLFFYAFEWGNVTGTGKEDRERATCQIMHLSDWYLMFLKGVEKSLHIDAVQRDFLLFSQVWMGYCGRQMSWEDEGGRRSLHMRTIFFYFF